MSYPKDLPAFRNALDALAYSPTNGLAVEVTAGLIGASSQVSVVPCCHAVIAALRPVKDTLKSEPPNGPALELLAGALYLCTTYQWAPPSGDPYAPSLAEIQTFLGTLEPPPPPPPEGGGE
jgi:hypothetical protein